MLKNGVIQFYNCFILRNHEIIKDDLWVEKGVIVDPEDLFYNKRVLPEARIDCFGALISPGFIDVQLNGGFGVDFSHDIDTVETGIVKVAKEVLAHGVTSFCPTVVSSYPHVYEKVLPHLRRRKGGRHGAEVLGAHVEGPFISPEKKGAHDPKTMRDFKDGMKSVHEVYRHLEHIRVITLAPELSGALEVCRELTSMGILVSMGHSMATISEGEEAVKNGASFITHLFNAMLPFHHRDPGLVGLLGSDQLPEDKIMFYGIIADGNHTHPSTTRIAYRAYPKGIVLVTDACSAMGLTQGIHHIGQQAIEIKGTKALVQGTKTLAGSIATMIACIQNFWQTTQCTKVEALEAATLHPAKLLGIENIKGTLNFGSHADFVLLNKDDLRVRSTFIGGECVYKKL